MVSENNDEGGGGGGGGWVGGGGGWVQKRMGVGGTEANFILMNTKITTPNQKIIF